jgi:hypothetical protein
VSTNPDEDRVYLEQPDTAFLSKATITTWETDRTFSSDWAAANFFTWAELLHPLQRQPLRILEIGSWEGRSALFFLNYLPYRIVASTRLAATSSTTSTLFAQLLEVGSPVRCQSRGLWTHREKSSSSPPCLRRFFQVGA